MGVKRCQKNGKPGFKWKGTNTCFTYEPNNSRSRDIARGKAISQGQAIESQENSEEEMEEEVDKNAVELQVDELQGAELDLVSFVEEPAIDVDFYYFNNNKIDLTFADTDKEERRVTGPAMIPDKHIERLDNDGSVYYVYFSKDTVKQAAELLFKKSRHDEANYEHQLSVSDAVIVESWIVQDPNNDTANFYGFDSSNINEGTWMISFKVESEDFWNKIKSGEVKGFSVEGSFIQNFSKESNNIKSTENDEKEHSGSSEEDDDEVLDAIYKYLEKIKNEK